MKFNEKMILIVSFVLIISCFLIYLPFTYIGKEPYKTTNFGNDVVAKMHEGGFLSEQINEIEEWKAGIENFTLHRFPLYSEILKADSDAEEMLNRSLSHLSREKKLFTLTFTGDYNNYISEDRTCMIRTFSQAPAQIMDDIDKSVELYNEIAREYPRLNVSIYFVQEPWSSDILKNTGIRIPKGQRYVNHFISKLDKNINVSYLPLASLDEYKENFYKTDHHWNIYGAYKGYQAIISLLGKRYEDIGQPIQARGFFPVSDVKFQGSIARQSLVYDVFDTIYDIDADVDPYSCEVDNQPEPSYFSEKWRYLEGIFDDSPFVNHYAKYFHSDYACVKFTFDNGKNRNLLVFADSLSNCMDYLLASHYSNTYYIDLRYYKETYGEDFDMKNFVEEKHIDDVLFFYMSDTGLCSFHDLGKDLIEEKN
ncbi:MAG: hypothetical protein N2171_02365 [Clostridia bacterium]|nr:hypothetical protein [Clostridia bacterium]